MINKAKLFILSGAILCAESPNLNTVTAADWITAPSTYTHDPYSGERVEQYAEIGPFYVFQDPSFSRSGYRNTRSSIQVNGSADNYHVVEQWGKEVRPYGEWRFPYRPFSVPYEGWGAPYAGLNLGGRGYYGYHGHGPRGFGAGGAVGPGIGRGPGNGANFQLQQGPRPWHDGFYPSYDQHDRKARNYYNYEQRPNPGIRRRE